MVSWDEWVEIGRFVESRWQRWTDEQLSGLAQDVRRRLPAIGLEDMFSVLNGFLDRGGKWAPSPAEVFAELQHVERTRPQPALVADVGGIGAREAADNQGFRSFRAWVLAEAAGAREERLAGSHAERWRRIYNRQEPNPGVEEWMSSIPG